MQIVKVMNNSLVLALDETGRECVLMGKGIGFNQAIGNPVTEEDIEKTFLLKDKKSY
ncbi:MAG: CAT RNA binding domain-containing protein [Vagococcus fluvialis]